MVVFVAAQRSPVGVILRKCLLLQQREGVSQVLVQESAVALQVIPAWVMVAYWVFPQTVMLSVGESLGVGVVAVAVLMPAVRRMRSTTPPPEEMFQRCGHGGSIRWFKEK